MSPFIKKLKEIKKETFRLTDFYIQELIDLFDFKNDDDKNFILGNDKKSSLYEGDIIQLLKALLKEKDKLCGFEDEIIENYKKKYLDNNSAITRTYCLVYLELFIDGFKTKDFKSLFRELYNTSCDDLIEKFTDIFREIDDKEYFVKSFNIHLEEETKYGNKYFGKNEIEFLFNLEEKYFIDFINGLSSDGLVYLKEFKKEEIEKCIEKLNILGDSDVNNRLKTLFLDIVNKLIEKKSHNYDYKQIISGFIKSEFASKLAHYLGNIYTELSLDIVRIKGDRFYGLWEIISIISSIIRKENIKELCELLSDNYIDVHIYENIEGGNRIDKKELLDEFKKYDSFNKKYKERYKALEKTKNEQEKYQQKERSKFNEGIKKIIEEEKDNPKGISEYLLYQFEESDYEDFKKNVKVIKTVKNQVKRFFELLHSDPEKYELHYTEKSQNGSSYRTHQFVVNNTFIRCLKFYKEFGFKVTDDILKKAIKYVPFAYSDDLEHIFAIVGDGKIEKEDVDYLLSIYDGTRTKDDLRYNNISTFTLFYEKYKSSFIQYSKTETQETFIKITNDTNYNGYERKYTAEKLAEIGEEKQLLDLFNQYKTDEKYFSNIEKKELEIAIISSKALIKRFPKTESKKTIIDWYIKQLTVRVPLYIEHGDGMHGISDLESELSWDLNEEKSFISVFKYINDLDFENDIKELLKHSFEITEESRRDYGLFGNYIQQAIFNFYEGIENKEVSIFKKLNIYFKTLSFDKDSLLEFKLKYLNKLFDEYTKGLSPSQIKSISKDNFETPKIIEELQSKNKEQEKIIEEKEKQIISLLEIIRLNNLNCILFVEGKSDKIYLDYYYTLPENKDRNKPFIIEAGGSRGVLEFLQYYENYSSYSVPIIGMFDFDMTGYDQYIKLKHKKYLEHGDYDDFEKSYYKGKCKKHVDKNIYAFLLPVPKNNIEKQVLKDYKTDFGHDSKLEIEHLLYDVLRGIDDKNKRLNDELFGDIEHGFAGGEYIKLRNDKKVDFATKLLCGAFFGNDTPIGKEFFINFEPIFTLIDEIIEDSKKTTKS